MEYKVKMCVCVAAILNHTHRRSSWQKHQESSSQAIACIWPARACTHNTAHNNVDWVQSYAAAQTYEIACLLLRFVWWFIPTSVGREHTEERENFSLWIQTIPELSRRQMEWNFGLYLHSKELSVGNLNLGPVSPALICSLKSPSQ